jgi:hypothetical protein
MHEHSHMNTLRHSHIFTSFLEPCCIYQHTGGRLGV